MNEPRDFTAPRLQAPSWSALAVFAVFSFVALGLYARALHGPMVTDDFNYIASNPYVHDFGWSHFLDVWNPRGGAAMYIANYSPVTLLLHAAQVVAFGPATLGYHVSNVLMHALAASLLVAAFRRTGLSGWIALFGGALFLVHPANVEAVAWVSQLKTTTSLVFSLLALLCWPKRPALGVLCFALGLLAMPKAVAALPALFVLTRREPTESRDSSPGVGRAAKVGRSWGWLAGAVALFAVFALSEFETFRGSNANVAPLHEDPFYQGVNVVGIALRYLVMAVSTWGLSSFHQPAALDSLASPWFLGALPVLGVLAWRTGVTLRDRKPEAAWWLFAIAAFAPVSQVFPFLHPVADRYLYFILPGLIGGGLSWFAEVARARAWTPTRGAWRAVALAAAVLVVVAFGARAFERAALWRLAPLVLADSVKHYPDGLTAMLLEARREAAQGNVDAAVRSLQRARAKGFTGLGQMLSDPIYQSLRGQPAFDVLLREMTRTWIEHFESLRRPTQLQLKSLARCYLVLGDEPRAMAALRRAVEIGGPLSAELREQIASLGAGDGQAH